MLEAHKEITKRSFFICFMFMSTSREPSSRADHRRSKLSMRVKSLIHVVSYCVILKMAVNLKDLYGNSGRFKKINTL